MLLFNQRIVNRAEDRQRGGLGKSDKVELIPLNKVKDEFAGRPMVLIKAVFQLKLANHYKS